MICICMQPKEQDGAAIRFAIWQMEIQLCGETDLCGIACGFLFQYETLVSRGGTTDTQVSVWLSSYNVALIQIWIRSDRCGSSTTRYFKNDAVFPHNSPSEQQYLSGIFHNAGSNGILAESYGFQRYLKLHGQQQIFVFICLCVGQTLCKTQLLQCAV